MVYRSVRALDVRSADLAPENVDIYADMGSFERVPN